MSGRCAPVWPLVLAALVLGGCAHDPLGDPAFPGPDPIAHHAAPSDAGDAIIAQAIAAERVLAGTRGQPEGYIIDGGPRRAYRLDTGDRLRIFVYGQPNLSRLYIVDQSGKVSIPLIGGVKARGLTTYQLEGAIRGALGQRYVRDPQVTVDVQQNRPFFILGEVRTAGQFPYVTGMTVEMAVATAGGYGERANERRARLTRKVDGGTLVTEVGPDTEIEPGDTIYIFERFF